MARKSIFVSDKSGAEIADGDGAVVTVRFSDGRRPNREADLTNEEAVALADSLNARTVARRGRKPIAR